MWTVKKADFVVERRGDVELHSAVMDEQTISATTCCGTDSWLENLVHTCLICS